MLTPAWTTMRPHAQQSAAWRTRARFVALACGRGSGKTELAKRRLVRFLPVAKHWHDGPARYFYAGPTREQTKRGHWDHLKSLVPKSWLACEPSESNLVIKTRFNSELHLCGMDKPQRIEGLQWDGGVLDESSDQKPKSFDLSVLPALSHRDGWCWRIGVPKRHGVGARDFKNFCKNMAQESYAWPSEDILTPEQIAYAMKALDARDYAEQYCAHWGDATGCVHHAFGEHNIDDTVAYDPAQPIIVGSDFNVDPMSWCLMHASPGPLGLGELRVFDELFIRNCNTPLALDRLNEMYGRHEHGWLFIGDASAKARKTSANASDYIQIMGDTRFRGRRVSYPDSNPPRADRFASVNSMSMSASGHVRLRVHPRCVHLIQDLEDRSYRDGTNEPEDYGDVGHMSDALGYVVYRLFPLRAELEQSSSPQVHAQAT